MLVLLSANIGYLWPNIWPIRSIIMSAKPTVAFLQRALDEREVDIIALKARVSELEQALSRNVAMTPAQQRKAGVDALAKTIKDYDQMTGHQQRKAIARARFIEKYGYAPETAKARISASITG
jgi:hypothetical protein